MTTRAETTPATASPAAIWAGMITVYLVWGSTYLAIRFGVETLPPFLMAGIRFLIAGGVLFAARRLAGDALPEPRHWRSALVIGLFLLLAGNGLVTWAEQRVVSGVAALLIGSTPLWFVLGTTVLERRRPDGRTLFGVLLGFVGIFLLINPWQEASGGYYLPGMLAIVAASMLWAFGSLYSRGAPLPASPLMATASEMLAGGAALTLVGSLLGEWSRLDLAAVSLRSWLGLLYLIVFGSLVAFSAYTWLLRNAPTSLVSTYAYVNPLVAILLGNLLASEPLSLRVLLAAAVILSAVVIITRRKG